MIDSFVVFKWAKPGYRSKFTALNVNTTFRMVRRFLPGDYKFICVTDDATGLDPRITVVPLWDDYAHIPNPTWANGPSCYRRLRVFSDWFAQIAGNRFAVCDLDAVFANDLRPIFYRRESLLMWRTTHPKILFCAALFMVEAGKHRYLWDDFDPERSPREASEAGFKGSDQGWISYRARGAIAGWTRADGIYSYHAAPLDRAPKRLPRDARIVMFNGKPDPWEYTAHVRSPWIRRYYV